MDYPVLYTYWGQPVVEILYDDFTGVEFEIVRGADIIAPPVGASCSDMQDGKLSIAKQFDGQDYDLFWSYDGRGNIAITQDTSNDTYAGLSGNRMVWVKGEGASAEIYVAEIADSDSDQVPDVYDNCPNIANAGQEDSDGNGVGDACEAPPITSNFSFVVDVTSEWSTGYCGDLYAVNNGSTTVPHPYSVNFTLPAGDVFSSTWSGNISRNGDNATVIFYEWAEHLAPGDRSSDPFGFCVRSKSEFTNFSDYTPDFSKVSVNFNVSSQWKTGYCGRFAFTYNGNEAYIPHPNGMKFSLSESTIIDSAWGYLDYSRTGNEVIVINDVEPDLEPGISNNAFGYCSMGTILPTNIVVQP